jgi:hypothetical protein
MSRALRRLTHTLTRREHEPRRLARELFIESTDGDAIINHADRMFWGLNERNGAGGLQNIMDIPGIVMWDDDTPMKATVEGKQIAPSLTDFASDRPFHVDELINDWVVEVAFATNDAGTRADPVIVRDGDRGRLIPVFQAADQNDPKGVAAEIIAYLLGSSAARPSLADRHAGDLANKPLRHQVQENREPEPAIDPDGHLSRRPRRPESSRPTARSTGA